MDLLETRDRGLLRQFFATDPGGHLYQWGDLADPMFLQSRWFVAAEQGSIASLLLVFTGLETPAMLPSGDLAGMERLLGRFSDQLPERCYTKLSDAQRPLLEQYFDLTEPVGVTVMALDEFHPCPAAPGVKLAMITAAAPIEPLLRLYQDYPGNFFDRSHLDSGLYAGAWIDGELAAAGGTHAFAPPEGVAALGNIVTLARYRRRGLCQAVVSYLVKALRAAGCRHIGLHVEHDNAPAIRCYEKLGFRAHSRVTQYLALRHH